MCVHAQLLVPRRVEVGLDGLCLPFDGGPLVRDELDLNVGVAVAVGVHRDQVPRLNHCR